VQVVEVPGGEGAVYRYAGAGPISSYVAGDSGPYLIEVLGDVTAAADQALRELGVRMNALEMFSESSYAARLDREQSERLRALPFIKEVRILQPDDKLDSSRFAGFGVQRIEVTIDLLDVSDEKLTVITALLEELGARVLRAQPGTVCAEVSVETLQKITRISDVIWVEPNFTNRATVEDRR